MECSQIANVIVVLCRLMPLVCLKRLFKVREGGLELKLHCQLLSVDELVALSSSRYHNDLNAALTNHP